MLNRRSIIGLIAGAPAAAQAMPQVAVAKEAVGYGVNSTIGLGGLGGGAATDWIKTRVAEIKKDLAEIGKDKAERLVEIRRNITHVDPDLAALKSFSDTRKVLIQAERLYERDVASQRSWLTRQLSDLLQQSGQPADP